MKTATKSGLLILVVICLVLLGSQAIIVCSQPSEVLMHRNTPPNLQERRAEQKEKMLHSLSLNEENFKAASRRKEVNPVGFVTAALHLSTTQRLLDQKQQANENFQQAIAVFDNIDSSTKEELVRQFWDAAKTALDKSETKDEENSIINSILDMEARNHIAPLPHGINVVVTYYGYLKRNDDCIAFLSRALELVKKTKPVNHGSIREITRNLVTLFQRSKQPEKVEEYLKLSLSIADGDGDTNRVYTVDPLVALAVFYIEQKRLPEAENYASKAYSAAESDITKCRLDELYQIPTAYVRLDYLQPADEFLRRVVTAKAIHFPSERLSRIGASVQALVRKYMKAGQYDKAQAILEAWNKVQGSEPERHSGTLDALQEVYLAQAGELLRAGDKRKSQQLVKKSLLLFESAINGEPTQNSSYIEHMHTRRERLLRQYGLQTEKQSY